MGTLIFSPFIFSVFFLLGTLIFSPFIFSGFFPIGNCDICLFIFFYNYFLSIGLLRRPSTHGVIVLLFLADFNVIQICQFVFSIHFWRIPFLLKKNKKILPFTRRIPLLILVKSIIIRLYLPFSDWFWTKRNFFWFQINQNSMIMIRFWLI